MFILYFYIFVNQSLETEKFLLNFQHTIGRKDLVIVMIIIKSFFLFKSIYTYFSKYSNINLLMIKKIKILYKN